VAGALFRARVAAAAGCSAVVSTSSWSVSIPPYLRPIEEEDCSSIGDCDPRAAVSNSSSCSSGGDENRHELSSGINVAASDNTVAERTATHEPLPFDTVSSAANSLCDGMGRKKRHI